MKFALILMIKNESKILQRCLQAVENVVDCFCILDTGSTDNTVEIANEFLKTHTGCVTVEPWKNFGHNRTVSFQNAQKYIRDELKWDLKETYGLLLDADMLFVPGTLKQQKLDKIGYRFIQVNGSLEYYNCRLIRMDFPWKCIGVTHEYWEGPTESLPKEICFIDDRNDGGCKHDKYERDCKLLEKGLEEEPQNAIRYMFYLAQTYKCMHRFKDSIKMYKKRIAAGGWPEEVWYSHMMIGDCWKALGNIGKFEYWMQLAHAYRQSRVESIYRLAEHYRVVGHHYKAYHYTKIGLATPYPKDDVLFIEGDVYRGKFDYEASILDYYVHDDKTIGLRDSIRYLLKQGNHMYNVLSNLKFYIKPIPSVKTPLNIPSVFGEDFRPSAVSVLDYPYANIRFVNYLPPLDGGFRTKNGEDVQTLNAYMNIETKEVIKMMSYDSITLPKFPTRVKGLEDVRLSKRDNDIWFTATNIREYDPNVRVITGKYDVDNGNFIDVKVLKSPKNVECEKNWLPIKDTDLMIYSWHPYCLIDTDSNIKVSVPTPPLFNLFRGSAPPVKYDDNTYICLVHLVEYAAIRNYFHCFVQLDSNFKPIKISLPFVFNSISIEYCLSIRKIDDKIECFPGFMESNPHKVSINITDLEWVTL